MLRLWDAQECGRAGAGRVSGDGRHGSGGVPPGAGRAALESLAVADALALS